MPGARAGAEKKVQAGGKETKRKRENKPELSNVVCDAADELGARLAFESHAIVEISLREGYLMSPLLFFLSELDSSFD